MGEFVKLTAADGHELAAYVARPELAGQKPLGAVVVVQEIFGVNPHIRSVVDGFAQEGYLAIAPALFDRVERGVELEYSGEGWKHAVELMGKLDPKTALLDVAAAFQQAKKEQDRGVAVVGFCYGGFMSWLAATDGKVVDMQPACCVGYYPGGIGKVAEKEPSCPVMLHFGANDSHIAPEQREAVAAAHPDVQIFVYEGAEHGFNCDARESFNPQATALARDRTLAFLKSNLG